MKCKATSTTSVGDVTETVTCKKPADHVNDEATENHWGVTPSGNDVVWSEVVLRPPAKEA